MLLSGLHSSRKALVLNDTEIDCKQEDLPLEELANILIRSAAQQPTDKYVKPVQERDGQLPKVITFPYSRHSSYVELRNLLRIFLPMDVYPCTVDKVNWHEGESTIL
jgi:DNA cross-link repair 1C protein